MKQNGKYNPFTFWGKILALSFVLIIAGFLIEFISGYSQVFKTACGLAVFSILALVLYSIIEFIARLFAKGRK